MSLKAAIKDAITRQNLVFRALIFGVAWLFLPFWLFLSIALYLYFVPFFKPFDMALPFASVVFFAWTGAMGIFYALFLAVIFYIILGLKDMVFIERKPMQEILILLIIFTAFNNLFYKFGGSSGSGAFFWTIVLSAVFFLLVRNFLYSGNLPDALRGNLAAKNNFPLVAAAVAAIILLELSIAVIALPLSFIYQTAIMFLSATLLLEIAGDYFAGSLTRRVLLADFSILFIFLVIILGFAPWGL